MKKSVCSMLIAMVVSSTAFAGSSSSNVQVTANLGQLESVLKDGIYSINQNQQLSLSKNTTAGVFLTSTNKDYGVSYRIYQGKKEVCNQGVRVKFSSQSSIVCGNLTGTIEVQNEANRPNSTTKTVVINLTEPGAEVPSTIIKITKDIALSVSIGSK